MISQIALGSALMLTTVLVAGASVMTLETLFRAARYWLVRPPHRPKLMMLVMLASLWMLAMITVDVWLWALAFRALDVFHDLEHAVYFALVSFTTLGYGDVVLPTEWRILGAMAAANGLLNIGLMTAFMVETLRHVRVQQFEFMHR